MKKLLKPEYFAVISILLFGILISLTMPPGAGFDEETHLARILEMSTGELLSNRYLSGGERYPMALYDVSYRQYKNLDPVTWDMWIKQLSIRIDWEDTTDYQTRSLYFPLLYLPQALLMAVGRALNPPVVLLYYFLRLTYVILYAWLIFLAIRVIPFGKWVVTILALSPMALIQASTISVDALNNGVCFLFVAWIFYLISRESSPVNKSEFAITLALIFLICTLKVNFILLLLLLFMLPRTLFGSKRQYASLVVFTIFCVSVVCVGWNLLTVQQIGSATNFGDTKPIEQLKYMIQEPFSFLGVLLRNLRTQLPAYFTQWIGVAGYGYWSMPNFIYWLYSTILGAAVLNSAAGQLIPIRRRILLFAVFIVQAVAIIAILYVTSNPVRSTQIEGVQGRYFIGAAPLLFLGILPSKAFIKISFNWLLGGTLITNLIVLAAITVSYHVICGNHYFTRGLCYLPKYKNWAPIESPALQMTGIASVKQDFTPQCNNLTQIRLWIKDAGQLPTESIVVEFGDANSSEVILKRILTQPELTPETWLVLDLDQIENSKRQHYYLKIKPVDREAEQAISLAYFDTDEYFAGKALLNNNDLYSDLLFQYGCLFGLEKLIQGNP